MRKKYVEPQIGFVVCDDGPAREIEESQSRFHKIKDAWRKYEAVNHGELRWT